ncbi:MAG: M28 family metallopeptidase [Anaerolineae bacterium]|nr:M28 family metallopeptidase [Anaerolineae bacterium]
MTKRTCLTFIAFLFISFASAACSPADAVDIQVSPKEIGFSGERAYAIEEDFVSLFPNRDSGQPNNRLAVEWLKENYESLELSCSIDEWEIVNYSRPVALNNLVCRLEGKDAQEILIVSHHDQAPDTIEGADNDGSGVAIMLHLAEVFSAGSQPKYTLTFVSTDAEEYGMIGTGRYVQTHPDVSRIVAGISLDNLGRDYYNSMNMELIGQFRGYGPIWLALATRAAAEVSGAEWEVNLRAPLDQILDQAGPISFMDQGPMVAAGIPAIGLAAGVPPEFQELHYQLWHDPGDTMQYQSPESLGQSGLIAEALVRQVLSMHEFPQQSGPYIYFDGSGQMLRGAPLWLLFVAFVSIFFIAAARLQPGSIAEKWQGFRSALPHFLSLWLPMVASLLLLYLMVAVGIMDEYHLYPATSKDAAVYNPRWTAIFIYVLGSGVFFYLARWLHKKRLAFARRPDHTSVKGLAMLIVGLSGIYVLVKNPFSLLFFVPLLFWLLIRGRSGWGRILEVVLYFMGGLVFYGLFFFFGFVIFDYQFAFGWFLLMMFSIQMIGFVTASLLAAVIAAGLSLVVPPAEHP